MKAFLLMAVSAGKEEGIISAVKERFHVVEFHRLYGTYDAIAVVELQNIGELTRAMEGLLNGDHGVIHIEALVERGGDDGS